MKLTPGWKGRLDTFQLENLKKPRKHLLSKTTFWTDKEKDLDKRQCKWTLFHQAQNNDQF